MRRLTINHLLDHTVRVWRPVVTRDRYGAEQRFYKSIFDADAALNRSVTPIADTGPGLTPTGRLRLYMIPTVDVQTRDVLEVLTGPDAGRRWEVDQPPVRPRDHHTQIDTVAFSGTIAELFFPARVSVFTEDGSFTVPDDVHMVMAIMLGGGAGGAGGGGGSSTRGAGGGTGGGTPPIFSIPIPVTPGDELVIAIGDGGIGGLGGVGSLVGDGTDGAEGTDGGATTITCPDARVYTACGGNGTRSQQGSRGGRKGSVAAGAVSATDLTASPSCTAITRTLAAQSNVLWAAGAGFAGAGVVGGAGGFASIPPFTGHYNVTNPAAGRLPQTHASQVARDLIGLGMVAPRHAEGGTGGAANGAPGTDGQDANTPGGAGGGGGGGGSQSDGGDGGDGFPGLVIIHYVALTDASIT